MGECQYSGDSWQTPWQGAVLHFGNNLKHIFITCDLGPPLSQDQVRLTVSAVFSLVTPTCSLPLPPPPLLTTLGSTTPTTTNQPTGE